jgi:TRAP-type mannitol/chloroaromatic compound transport system permease small subunit
MHSQDSLDRMEKVADLLDEIAELTGRMVSWLTLGLVLVTLAVVILRYVFDIGSIALQESGTYLHAIVFMLGAAYTLKHDGHVRVDIFYQQRTPRVRAWINLLGTLLLLMPVCMLIFISSLDYVISSWTIQEGSREAGGLDAVYLLKTVIPLMALLLFLQGCSLCVRSLLVISGHAPPPEDFTGLDREL